MNTNVDENYNPVRDSDRTERARLLAKIKESERKLAAVAIHSSVALDPNYARSEVQCQKDLNTAREALARFEKRQQELYQYATSSETELAKEQVLKSATAFDQKLKALARTAKALVEDGAALTTALHIVDQGVPLSRSALNNAIKSRIIRELGDNSPIKFDGYGSAGAKPSVSLREFYDAALAK